MNVNQFYQEGRSARLIQNRFITNGICLLLLFVQCITSSTAQQPQKPALDAASLGSWPTLIANAVSNNGEYVSYIISQKGKTNELRIQSMHTSWKLAIPGGRKFQFIDEYERAVFLKTKDTLCLFNLKDKSVENITGINSYEVIRDHGKTYLCMRNKKEMILREMRSRKEKKFTNIIGYVVGKAGGAMAITFADTKGESICWYDLHTDQEYHVWSGKGNIGISVDPLGGQLAFIVKDVANGHHVFSIFHYEKGNTQAVKIWDTDRPGYEAISISPMDFRFSAEGGRLFFTGNRIRAKAKNDVKVTVWAYDDPYLQSQYSAQYRLKQITNPADVMLMINLHNNQIIRLINEGEFLADCDNADRYMIATKETGNESEADWMPSTQQNVYIINMYTGERKTVKENSKIWLDNLVIAPDGKYLLYYDRTRQNYYSVNTATGVELNLTGKLNEQWSAYGEENEAEQGRFAAGKISWLKQKSVALINGRYNLWKFDLAGKQQPVNLTAKINLDNKIIFSPAFNDESHSSTDILLLAFNRENKQQGIYRIDLQGKIKPEKLSMGDYLYENKYMPYRRIGKMSSANGKYYLVNRGNTENYPNLFLTDDFTTFIKVSDLHPEKDYNWMKAELHTFNTQDSSTTQGILYKPENFDPAKKYPIIFYCYETFSDRLNYYLFPEHSGGPIDVGYLVSNGYLVFMPDVNFKSPNMTGRSFFNSVMGAVQYLEVMPFIDTTKLGIQGHSFGAFGVNYILTHTDRFAAALSASGSSNMTSMNTALWETFGMVKMQHWQYRINKTLWERPDLYTENSPILFADKISTPLVLMVTKNDTQVPYTENRGLFISLRRLGKPVWMLDYEDENHVIMKEENRRDYEQKVMQFFNYYLKGKTLPIWLNPHKRLNK